MSIFLLDTLCFTTAIRIYFEQSASINPEFPHATFLWHQHTALKSNIFAVNRQTRQVCAYVDGLLDGQVHYAVDPSQSLRSTEGLCLGTWRLAAFNHHYCGFLKQVTVWRCVLSSEMIDHLASPAFNLQEALRKRAWRHVFSRGVGSMSVLFLEKQLVFQSSRSTSCQRKQSQRCKGSVEAV